MDISELRGFVEVVLVLAAFVTAFLFAKRIVRKELRLSLRVGAVSGATLTTLTLALLMFGEYSCTARVPANYSPDGKYVAILRWGLQGALGMDIATVNVRHRYSPFAKNVYFGPGVSPYPPRPNDTDPQIRWIDNTRLLIRYHDYPGYEQSCTSRVFNVDVICEPSLSPYPGGSQEQK